MRWSTKEKNSFCRRLFANDYGKKTSDNFNNFVSLFILNKFEKYETKVGRRMIFQNALIYRRHSPTTFFEILEIVRYSISCHTAQI